MSDEGKVLSRADFLAAVQLKREAVPVPELGGTVYVSELYAAQVMEYYEFVQKLKRDDKEGVSPSVSLELMAQLVSMAVCDAEGNQLFTEADVKNLSKSSPRILMTLSAKAMELSGLGADAVKEVVEQLKKNQNSDSSTS